VDELDVEVLVEARQPEGERRTEAHVRLGAEPLRVGSAHPRSSDDPGELPDEIEVAEQRGRAGLRVREAPAARRAPRAHRAEALRVVLVEVRGALRSV